MKKILLTIFILFFNLIALGANAPKSDYTIDEKIGQMIILGFDGNDVNSKEYRKTLQKIKKNEISGVILFQKNIKSKEDLTKMNEGFLNSNPIIPFISIDNEGGKISRSDFLKAPSAKEISKMKEKEARVEYEKMANILSKLKINFNFAPDVDLLIDKNSIIAKKDRSYGKDPNTVSKFANILIEEHEKKKILTSLKHFPGHGNIKGDTHKDFVDSTNTFSKDELIPYQNLAGKSDFSSVMISHIFNKNFDENYPASLSYKTIQGLLKEKIGYKGLIVSDDYDMDAVRKNYSLEEIVVNSINSGVNVMIFSNNLKYHDKNIDKKIRKIVEKNIKEGNIKKETIDKSFETILKTKALLKN